jgi:hypothetical protein
MYVQNISPLTALFADTPGQLEGDLGPALGAEAMHQLDDQLVLLHKA